MSASPMRSVIRVLADSPLVERIALDRDNDTVKVFYKSEEKNADAIRDIVRVVNYFFGVEYSSPNAFTLVNRKKPSSLPSTKNYHLNFYSGSDCEFNRIDIQEAYA
ncbi:MAG: hypothetical protein AAGF59_15640, partial [Pseudomonadota bacterium]